MRKKRSGKRILASFLILILAFTPVTVNAQRKKIAGLFQKYFISVPYERNLSEWFDELYKNEHVHIDSLRKGDSGYVFFRAKISDFHVLPTCDSIWLAIDMRRYSYRPLTGGRVEPGTPDSSLEVNQIYYFSMDATNEKEWESLFKSVIRDFKRYFLIYYPSIPPKGRFKTVWFSNEEHPSEPIIRMQYGKIEERKTYFIQLGLVVKMQTSG